MPNISIARLNELEAKEKKLSDLRDDKYVLAFVDDFQKNMAMYVAQIPRKSWPGWVTQCFNYAAKDHFVGSQLYNERHKEIK